MIGAAPFVVLTKKGVFPYSSWNYSPIHQIGFHVSSPPVKGDAWKAGGLNMT